MSFAMQEQLLFDLLFDRDLRERFGKSPMMALAGYDLDESERQDFAVIRHDALELDATMRVGLVLSQFCRAFPLTFSIVSSLDGGLGLLRSLIDTRTMRMPPLERMTTFGIRLKEKLSGMDAGSVREKALAISILEAELGMAWTGAALKSEVLKGNAVLPGQVALAPDWLTRSVGLAPFVSAAIIPDSYQHLKTALCPHMGAELWRHLNRTPLTQAQRQQVLQLNNPRILVARAEVCHVSRCEPTVEHRTVELSEGFAPLLQHVDGAGSVSDILMQLGVAGAPESLMAGVQAGFRQLLDNGMLTQG
ncbi:MAG: hypothetical protein Q7T32_07855 [Moraxellaceae bacterium]|nr:hypothetical protein [Moraxellaceae bacterium]